MTKHRLAPFLSFKGRAEEAMEFYASRLPGAKIIALVRYGKDHPFSTANTENFVLHGTLTFMEQEIMFIDMTEAHSMPDFNMAIALHAVCQDEAEFNKTYTALSLDATVLVEPQPIAQYRKLTCITDKFGITWQVVLE